MKILLVDDDLNLVEYYEKLFADHFGDEVQIAGCSGSGEISAETFDGVGIVILDQRLGDGEKGLDLIPLIRKLKPSVKIIMNSAYSGEELAVDALRHGVDDYVPGNKEHDDLLIGALKRVMSGINTERHIHAMITENRKNIDCIHNSCEQKLSILRDRVKKMAAVTAGIL